MITGFDFDGTLVHSWSGEPLGGVKEALHPYRTQKTFIATNQGGPTCRLMYGSSKYPTVQNVADRLCAALRVFDFRPDLVLISTYYTGNPNHGDWLSFAKNVVSRFPLALSRAGIGAIDYSVSAKPEWRKPQPGMLLHAAEYFGVTPSELRYIGDMESDEIAARQAGAQFHAAEDWLSEGGQARGMEPRPGLGR